MGGDDGGGRTHRTRAVRIHRAHDHPETRSHGRRFNEVQPSRVLQSDSARPSLQRERADIMAS